MGGRSLSLCAAVAVVCFLTSGRANAQATSYTYDALGRLVTAAHPGGVLMTYSYDAAGNRTQVTTAAPPPPPPPPGPLNVSITATSYTRTAISVPAPITCRGHAGTGPYEYYWQRVSGDGLTETSNVEYSATTGWVRPVASTTPRTSIWRCRVTDAAATIKYSANVAVSVRTN